MTRTRLLHGTLALLLGLSVTGCAESSGRFNFYEAKNPEHRPTYLGLPLRNGQIVLTEAKGDLSFVFSLIPDQFFLFTHSGIVSIEDGVPYVYQATGDYHVRLHSRVLDNVSGEVRRTPFELYAVPNLYGEVFDPPDGASGEAIVAYAKKRYEDKTEFDAYFRYDEHEKLFCTELLELALESGGAKAHGLVPVRDNASLKTAMRWLGVPLDTALPAGLYKDEAHYVGSFGQFPTRSAAYAYFEGKREIHRRFTRSQHLGYLFELHATGELTARANLQDFMARASRAANGMVPEPLPGDPRIASAVRRIADEMFGPAD